MILSRVSMVEGVTWGPSSRSLRHSLAGHELTKLLPPLRGLVYRPNRDMIQSHAEGLVALNVPIGTARWQVGTGRFFAHPRGRVTEDAEKHTVRVPRCFGHAGTPDESTGFERLNREPGWGGIS